MILFYPVAMHISLIYLLLIRLSLEAHRSNSIATEAILTTGAKEPMLRLSFNSDTGIKTTIPAALVQPTSTISLINEVQIDPQGPMVHNNSLPMFPCRNDGNIPSGIGYYCFCRNGCFYQSFNHTNCSSPPGPKGRISDSACPELVALATSKPLLKKTTKHTTSTTHTTKTYGTRGGEITFCCAP